MFKTRFSKENLSINSHAKHAEKEYALSSQDSTVLVLISAVIEVTVAVVDSVLNILFYAILILLSLF